MGDTEDRLPSAPLLRSSGSLVLGSREKNQTGRRVGFEDAPRGIARACVHTGMRPSRVRGRGGLWEVRAEEGRVETEATGRAPVASGRGQFSVQLTPGRWLAALPRQGPLAVGAALGCALHRAGQKFL